MKKTIGIITALMLFCMTLVSAGSIEDLNYQDKHRVWFWTEDENRQVDDYNVEIDADTLEGYDADYFKQRDKKTNRYISRNEDAWLEDNANVNIYSGGNGMDANRLSRYLIGIEGIFNVYDTFMDYLDNIFATKVAVENTNLRIDNIEAIMNLGPDATENEIAIEALTIGADRRGEPLKINGLTCTDGICIGVN